MHDQARGHYWTTGAAILFMGGLGLTFAFVIAAFSPELFGFIRFEASVTIALLYLGIGGYLVGTSWQDANQD